MRSNRPTASGSHVTTPKSGEMMKLLGPGLRVADLTLSRDELEAVRRVYGFTPEPPNERPPRPVMVEPDPKAWDSERRRAEQDHKKALQDWENWTDRDGPREFMQAGADRNCTREAQADGLRLMAWLARYVPTGEDPLKTLVMLASDSGLDVDPEDREWAETIVEEDEELEATGE